MSKNILDKLKYIIPLLVTLSIMFIVEHQPFAFFNSIQKSNIMDSSSPFLGQEMLSFLWQYRGMDLIIQSFFLFTAIIACIALLRAEGEE